MKRALTLLPFGMALALTTPLLWAGGNAENGRSKAVACSACHGADGNATDAQYPRLAGQYFGYLQQVLHEYKDGRRNNPIMKGFSATLSDQDIDDIALYYSSLPTRLHTLKGHVQGD